MTRKRKASDEVVEIAEEIASVVEDTSKPAPKRKASTKVNGTPVSTPSPEKKEEVLEPVFKRPVKNVKVKATATVRGVYGNMRYEIRQGEVYVFSEEMANWLIGQGRAI